MTPKTRSIHPKMTPKTRSIYPKNAPQDAIYISKKMTPKTRQEIKYIKNMKKHQKYKDQKLYKNQILQRSNISTKIRAEKLDFHAKFQINRLIFRQFRCTNANIYIYIYIYIYIEQHM